MRRIQGFKKFSCAFTNFHRLAFLIGIIVLLITVTMTESMLKPVYLRNKDLDNDYKKLVTDYELMESVTKCINDKKQKQKYRGMFETQKSRNKTSSGDIGLNIRTLASPKVGQDQVSGGVSVLCWHDAPVANVLWKPLAIR